MGGNSPTEGKLQVYHQGAWRVVCDSSGQWGDTEKAVVCRQLGYTPLNNPDDNSLESYFTKDWIYFNPFSDEFCNGSLFVLLQNVLCTGDESNIEQCNYTPALGSICSYAQTVRVSCQLTLPG